MPRSLRFQKATSSNPKRAADVQDPLNPDFSQHFSLTRLIKKKKGTGSRPEIKPEGEGGLLDPSFYNCALFATYE